MGRYMVEKGLTGIVRSSSSVPRKDNRLLAARNMTILCAANCWGWEESYIVSRPMKFENACRRLQRANVDSKDIGEDMPVHGKTITS